MTTQEKICILEKEKSKRKNSINISKNRIKLNEYDLENIDGEIKQLKAEQEVYNPSFQLAIGERYFRINDCGEIESLTFSNINSLCKWDITTNNIYKTQAQCEKGKQAIELRFDIDKYQTGKDVPWEGYATHDIKYIITEVIAATWNIDPELITRFGDRIKQLKEYL